MPDGTDLGTDYGMYSIGGTAELILRADGLVAVQRTMGSCQELPWAPYRANPLMASNPIGRQRTWPHEASGAFSWWRLLPLRTGRYRHALYAQ